ncbi:MAG: GNAT family N-acetyltransferase [Flavobacteriaceae bacterium]|nr:GNAT family N-acetyltransferase [Flavobacteriaceae bacterium]
MNYLIRKSTPNDMSQVLDLIKELATFEKEPDAVIITADYLVKEGFGKDSQFTCFVAEMEDEIVGMALIYYRFSTWKGKAIHLEDLIVKDKFRGIGIGKALYTKVIEYAAEKKVKRIEWAVLNWNLGAIKFYERSGANIMKDWYIAQMDEDGIKNYIATL